MVRPSPHDPDAAALASAWLALPEDPACAVAPLDRSAAELAAAALAWLGLPAALNSSKKSAVNAEFCHALTDAF